VSGRHFRTWPVDPQRAVVALVHGIAEHAGRYGHVAQRLNRHGYSVIAVDLTGHGHSPGWPGEVNGSSDWHADVDALLERARSAARSSPVFLMGHSLGALIVASYATERPGCADGLILSAPAVLAGEAYLRASAEGSGVPPETISRDPEVVRAYIDDPLVFGDQVGPELNAYALELAIVTNADAGRIRLPTLILQGDADLIADPEGTRDLFEALGSMDKTLRVYEGLYHEVLNEPEKDRVLDHLVAWLAERAPD
jgi:alpha-beta hydrolase superfamily lysophospholipase